MKFSIRQVDKTVLIKSEFGVKRTIGVSFHAPTGTVQFSFCIVTSIGRVMYATSCIVFPSLSHTHTFQ